MNLILVEASELRDGICALADRRARHIRDVLRAGVGDVVRAGVVGAHAGRATIVSDDGTTIQLAMPAVGSERIDADAPRGMPIELVLAVPRPKAMSRAIEIAASFGVARIDLVNSWRVDKAYLDSPKLEPSALALSARLGAEQGGTTHVPAVQVHRRLMALLDERFPAARADGPRAGRYLAHPGATAKPIERAFSSRPASVLAIGPDGGWIAREVETFVARGFTPVSIGSSILRTEAAIAAALAQLDLLARVSDR